MDNSSSPNPSLEHLVDRQLLACVDRLLQDSQALTPMLSAMVAELPRSRYQRELSRLTDQLKRGASAEELCRSRDTIAILLPLLATEGTTDQVGRRLNKLLTDSIREADRRRQWRRVLAYPLSVLLLCLAVFLFLCVVVVPVFDEIFQEFGLHLPRVTQALVAVSRLLSHQLLACLLALACCIAVVYLLWRFFLWTGLFSALTSGGSRQVSAMAVFVRRLAEAISASLPLPAALQVAGMTTPDAKLSAAAQQLAVDTADDPHGAGRRLADNRAALWFPAPMSQLLDAHRAALQPDVNGGETADQNALNAARASAVRSLDALADSLVERVHSRFDPRSGIVAQFSLVAVGLLVAGALAALLLPLLNMMTSLL